MAEKKTRKLGPVRDVKLGNTVLTHGGAKYAREPFEHGKRGQRVLIDQDPDGNPTPGRIWLGVPTTERGPQLAWSWVHESAVDGVRYWWPGAELEKTNEHTGAEARTMHPEVRNQLIKWGELTGVDPLPDDPYPQPRTDREAGVIPPHPQGPAHGRL